MIILFLVLMSCVNNSGNNSVNKTELILNTNKAITLINFYKIFKDLIVDLDNSFKDKIIDILNDFG